MYKYLEVMISQMLQLYHPNDIAAALINYAFYIFYDTLDPEEYDKVVSKMTQIAAEIKNKESAKKVLH